MSLIVFVLPGAGTYTHASSAKALRLPPLFPAELNASIYVRARDVIGVYLQEQIFACCTEIFAFRLGWCWICDVLCV